MWKAVATSAALLGCAELAGLGDFQDHAGGPPGPGGASTGGASTVGGGGAGTGGPAGGGLGGELGGGGVSGGSTCDAYCQLVHDDDPIAYWRFGEASIGAPVTDELTMFPGVYEQSGAGVIEVQQPALIASDDTAVRIKGSGVPSSARVVVDPGPNFPGRAAFTIEMWLRVTLIEYGLPISRTAAGNPVGFHFLITENPNELYFRRTVGTETDTVVAPLPGVATTAHVVGTFDGEMMRLYLAGILEDELPSDKMLENRNEPLLFGHSMRDAVIDEAAIYAYALSLEAIKAHYELGSAR